MSAVHPQVPTEDDTFTCEGAEIFLRCVNEDGVHMGDLRIAEATAPLHANTLVNAANAGMQVMKTKLVDRAIADIFQEDRATGSDNDGEAGEEIRRGGDQP